MPPYLMPGLTPETASDICMDQCRAMCCRGPLILTLTQAEALIFERNSVALGVALKLSKSPDNGGWVKFADLPSNVEIRDEIQLFENSD